MSTASILDTNTWSTVPAFLTEADHRKLAIVESTYSPAAASLHYEGLMSTHGPHPYLQVRLASQMRKLHSLYSAVLLLRQARVTIADSDDPALADVLADWEAVWEAEVQRAKSRKVLYHQHYKLANLHKFPITFPIAPDGHDIVKEEWQRLFPQGSELFSKYLNSLAIETNHLENTFYITVGSTHDLIRHGISAAVVEAEHSSKIHDSDVIKNILDDILAAYDLLLPAVKNPKELTPELVRRVHARLMRTCRYGESKYTPPGVTRTSTKLAVVIQGTTNIECCPIEQVDPELEYICKMAQQYIKSWRNPFATASWLHLILGRCHPFNDGNGRLTRLIASIPLLAHGYPPISIMANERAVYYEGIQKAYEGDHTFLIASVLRGMQATLKDVQALA